jgi:hypothetical protein
LFKIIDYISNFINKFKVLRAFFLYRDNKDITPRQEEFTRISVYSLVINRKWPFGHFHVYLCSFYIIKKNKIYFLSFHKKHAIAGKTVTAAIILTKNMNVNRIPIST